MPVRAKFKLNSIEKTMSSKFNEAEGTYDPCEMDTLKFSPTYSNDPESENKKFWAATPGGSLTLNCVNADAVASFELGAEYYLDFTKAEAK